MLTYSSAVTSHNYPYYKRHGLTFQSGMTLADVEKSVILETLREQSFNRTHTAKVLGIGIRTLQRKIKQYREIDHNVVVDFPSR